MSREDFLTTNVRNDMVNGKQTCLSDDQKAVDSHLQGVCIDCARRFHGSFN